MPFYELHKYHLISVISLFILGLVFCLNIIP